jgi:hypothetical protein
LTEKSGDGEAVKSLSKKSSIMLITIGFTSLNLNSSRLMLATTHKLLVLKKLAETLSLEQVLHLNSLWVMAGPILVPVSLILPCAETVLCGPLTDNPSHSEPVLSTKSTTKELVGKLSSKWASPPSTVVTELDSGSPLTLEKSK